MRGRGQREQPSVRPPTRQEIIRRQCAKRSEGDRIEALRRGAGEQVVKIAAKPLGIADGDGGLIIKVREMRYLVGDVPANTRRSPVPLFSGEVTDDVVERVLLGDEVAAKFVETAHDTSSAVGIST